MKKTAFKIILFVVCLALVVFLLLPFLQTPAAQPTGLQTAQTANPQIFTSNPLTALVNRIARFFTNRNKKQSAPQTLTNRQADEQFGTPVDEQELYADARAATQNYISTEAAPQAGVQARGSFGDASLQTEEGDWVLIRQTAPEDAVRGMHEINTKDNPYDIYVRQERAARFDPAAQSAPKQELPDSKWARLFNPIKRFLGFDTPKAANTGSFSGSGREEGARLASSERMGSSRDTSVSSSGSASAGMDMPSFGATGAAAENAAPEQNAASLLAYLSPDYVLNEVADSLADAKYPNPQNNKDRNAKEAYRQERMAEARQYFLERSQERLNRLAAGQEPQDELKNMLEFSCLNKAPRPVKSSACMEDNPDSKPATKQQLQDVKLKNQQDFYQKTHLPMPPAPITPIIGRATGLPEEEIDESVTSPDYTKTMEIYQFMLQNEDCSSKSCYWVANAHQNNTELSDSVAASGAVFKGDPLDKYNQIEQQFTQYKLAQLPPNATEEEKQAAQAQAEQFAPPYILYTVDNLKAIQAKNNEAMRNRDIQGGAALYALTAPIGQQLSKDLNSTIFFYGKDDSFINADENPSFEARSHVLTETLADQIQFFQQVAQELRRNTSQEIVQDQTRAKAQELQQEFQKGRKAYDKQHGGR